MAMGIITKNRKQITWIGLYDNIQNDIINNTNVLKQAKTELTLKKQTLQDRLVEYVSLQKLMQHNSHKQSDTYLNDNNSNTNNHNDRLYNPFIVYIYPNNSEFIYSTNDDNTEVNISCNKSLIEQTTSDVIYKQLGFSNVHTYELNTMCPYNELINEYPKQYIIS